MTKKMKCFCNAGFACGQRSINVSICLQAPRMPGLALVEQGNKETGIRQNGIQFPRSLDAIQPLPILLPPKPFMCFLLVARSPGPKSTHPIPTSRGGRLAARRSAPSIRHSRMTLMWSTLRHPQSGEERLPPLHPVAPAPGFPCGKCTTAIKICNTTEKPFQCMGFGEAP